MNKQIWVARANDGNDSFICGANTFEVADKVGRQYAQDHKTTFYLRRYHEDETGNEKSFGKDRQAYIILQAALALNEVQSRGRAAEIARISYEDMHELMDKLLEMKI